MGVPPIHSLQHRIFHEINYPAIGVAPFMDRIFHYKPSISGYSSPPSMETPFIDCFIDYPLVNQHSY